MYHQNTVEITHHRLAKPMESAKLMEILDLKHYKSCQIVGILVSVGVCPAPLGLVQIRIGLSDPPGFGQQSPGWD